MPRRIIRPHSPEFLIGLRNIGAALGISEQTVRRWMRQEGLPVALMPDGHYATSKLLISLWLLSRIASPPVARGVD
jgi:hypothetical protein